MHSAWLLLSAEQADFLFGISDLFRETTYFLGSPSLVNESLDCLTRIQRIQIQVGERHGRSPDMTP